MSTSKKAMNGGGKGKMLSFEWQEGTQNEESLMRIRKRQRKKIHTPNAVPKANCEY